MKQDAEANAADDEKRKALVEARNMADQAVYAAEKAVKDHGEKAGAEVVRDVTDKIEALDAGADDYMTKPFGIGELLARARANIRRPRGSQVHTSIVQNFTNDSGSVFTFGNVHVDFPSRVVKRDGAEVHLTPIEYRLLCFLIENISRVLTHRQLLLKVWGSAAADQSHYLRIYMGHLRQKLEIDPAQPKHFLTETGVGYRMVK